MEYFIPNYGFKYCNLKYVTQFEIYYEVFSAVMVSKKFPIPKYIKYTFCWVDIYNLGYYTQLRIFSFNLKVSDHDNRI